MLSILQQGSRNVSTIVAELKACKSLGQIHEAVKHIGCDSNVWIANTLINMYGRCGSPQQALKVFEKMPSRTVASWNALIMGYVDNGQSEKALDSFFRMGAECFPDARTFVYLLKACNELGSRGQLQKEDIHARGMAIHLLASTVGFGSDMYVESTLVYMYARSRIMGDARRVFDNMKETNVVSWNVLLLGYAEIGEGEKVMELFSGMRRENCEPDGITFVAALKACVDRISRVRVVHLLASTKACDLDAYVISTLVDIYAKCGSMTESRRSFDSMTEPDVVCWTALILGYADNGMAEESLFWFGRAVCTPNERTFVSALKACTDLAAKQESGRERGKAVHLLSSCYGCDSDVYVGNTLVDMYAKCGNMSVARRVFDTLPHHTIVPWNALVSGYADNGDALTALVFFSRMGRSKVCAPDEVTFMAALKSLTVLENGLSRAGCRERGRAMHVIALRNGKMEMFLECTLVDMYAKCDSMSEAHRVFDNMKCRDLVSWNTLMLGYADKGEGGTVLNLLVHMKREGFEPDATAYISALRACSTLGALEVGRKIHLEALSRGFQNDGILANCVVDFYTRCGSLTEAEQVFKSHPSRGLVTWTTLMTGYGRIGDAEGVFRLFSGMLDAGLVPDSITLSCILTACNHAGLADKGKNYFDSMPDKHGIVLDVEHYTCMIDMNGRANKLDEAMALLRSMPFGPDAVTWMAVLGACRKWKNVELGKLAFQASLSLEYCRSGAYVLMRTLYKSEEQASRMQLRVCNTAEQGLLLSGDSEDDGMQMTDGHEMQ